MEISEFEILLNRVMILSDKVAGLKVQNKILSKRNNQLEFENGELSRKLTQINHNLQKSCKEYTNLTEVNHDLKKENGRYKAELEELKDKIKEYCNDD